LWFVNSVFRFPDDIIPPPRALPPFLALSNDQVIRGFVEHMSFLVAAFLFIASDSRESGLLAPCRSAIEIAKRLAQIYSEKERKRDHFVIIGRHLSFEPSDAPPRAVPIPIGPRWADALEAAVVWCIASDQAVVFGNEPHFADEQPNQDAGACLRDFRYVCYVCRVPES
jgi:hypothetical protein